MKVINNAAELADYTEGFKENPYQVNRISYNGRIQIYHSRRWVDENKAKWVEDYFHPGFFIQRGAYYPIYFSVGFRYTPTNFSERDPDTWIILQFRDMPDAETCDAELFESKAKILYTKKNADRFRVHMSDEDLIRAGFLQGKVNPEYWFYKTEFKHLDSKLPYRKFDATKSKLSKSMLVDNLTMLGKSAEEIAEEVSKVWKRNIANGTESLTYSVFEGNQKTFGLEIETCIGRLTDKDVESLNVKAVHDGSLRDAAGNTPGGEYVTGVLVGDAGLVQVHELCRILSKRCDVNSQCGVHVHVGSLNWGKEDTIYAYVLGELLQKEIFSMLPMSRRDNSYCRALTGIALPKFKELIQAKSKGHYNIIVDDLYDEIYKEVTFIKGKNIRLLHEGANINPNNSIITSTTINKDVNHPLGTKCGYDKNAQRYCWLNFVTLMYNTKGGSNSRTLEFRPHSATMNFIKIKNWIKICMAFCQYVEAHKAEINKMDVTLEKMIMTVYPRTGQSLVKYINERKELFKVKGEAVDYVESVIPDKKSIKEVTQCV